VYHQAQREALLLNSEEVTQRLGRMLARQPRQTRSVQRSPRALNHMLPPGPRTPRLQAHMESLRRANAEDATPARVKRVPRSIDATAVREQNSGTVARRRASSGT
jgi:hypothetical protein